MDEETLERFMSKVDKRDDGCWLWTGCKAQGYGLFHFEGKKCLAHRLMYLHCFGEFTKGLVICHTCKNKCVNPEHLEEDTQSKNVGDDRVRDGTDNRGENCYSAKLTATQVLEIRRRSTENQRLLGEEFGVNYRTIACIIHRRIWKHI